MSLFRIPASTPGAATTTVQMAETARQLGYEPAHNGIPATHVVNGTPPKVPDTAGGAR